MGGFTGGGVAAARGWAAPDALRYGSATAMSIASAGMVVLRKNARRQRCVSTRRDASPHTRTTALRVGQARRRADDRAGQGELRRGPLKNRAVRRSRSKMPSRPGDPARAQRRLAKAAPPDADAIAATERARHGVAARAGPASRVLTARAQASVLAAGTGSASRVRTAQCHPGLEHGLMRFSFVRAYGGPAMRARTGRRTSSARFRARAPPGRRSARRRRR